MGIQRLTMVATSDDEDESQCPPLQQKRQKPSASGEDRSKQRKREMVKFQEEDDGQEEEADKKKKRKPKDEEMEGSKSAGGQEVHPSKDAKPIGDAVRFSGKGKGRRTHYKSFKLDGNQYVIEDPVLLSPEDKQQKPYVAIIKDISQSQNGSMMVTGQWFYRPEEAERQGGGNWQSHDTRDLFYSFHRDEVPAKSVMHKCVVHFVPVHKQLPNCKQHPGFIVQNVYDFVERKLWKLTDKDCEENKQQEIDDLVQKSLQCLGDLPDIVTEEAPTDQEDQMKKKRRYYNWIHLRLQDFKTVSEYNSAMFRITSQLKLCGENVTDEDMLEKTFSTFHASNLLLQQQYREKGFKKYAELISCLLVAEQNNKLLLKNHESRPTGSTPFPEANAVTNDSFSSRGHGCKGGSSRGHGRGRDRSNSRNLKLGKNHKREASGHKKHAEHTCYRCGSKGHWSRTCRTPRHLVELYQGSLKMCSNGSKIEVNHVEDPKLEDADFLA